MEAEYDNEFIKWYEGIFKENQFGMHSSTVKDVARMAWNEAKRKYEKKDARTK